MHGATRATTGGLVLDAVVPISYSVAHEQLYHASRATSGWRATSGAGSGSSLAAILWRFLAEHERCVARAAGTKRFELVTVVPSGR